MAIDSAQARKKIEAIRDLPTLPAVVSEIVSKAGSPKTNAADIGNLIEQDQALTAKVLKLVNSSFYGFPGQIKSIQHAVVILGFNKVKNVILTASVFDLTKGRTANQLNIPKFWMHSLGAAIGAKVATRALGGSLQPEDAFVGGLVHGIGIVILDMFLSEEYSPVIEMANTKPCPLVIAEKEILGFTHSTVGGWIAERWKLPPTLTSAVKNYNTPLQARDDREMVVAVHLGNILSRALGIGYAGDPCIPEFNETIWKHYGLDMKFLDESLGMMLAELRRAKEFFDLIEDEGN